jgi:hypothetical protein
MRITFAVRQTRQGAVIRSTSHHLAQMDESQEMWLSDETKIFAQLLKLPLQRDHSWMRVTSCIMTSFIDDRIEQGSVWRG